MHITKAWESFFNKNLPNIILRLFVMTAGLACVAMGVALSRHTGLGTSPISCLPAVLSFVTPLTIGTYTMILNLLFVGIQIALLRHDFHPVQLLQVVFVFVFSVAIDFFVGVVDALPVVNYAEAMALSVISCFFTAGGVFLQVKAALIMLPGDGIVLTVSRVFHLDFAKCKVTFDSSLVVIATILSVITMGGLFGVREGTIVAALITGWIMKLLNHLFPHFERFAPVEGHLSLTSKRTEEEEMEPIAD